MTNQNRGCIGSSPPLRWCIRITMAGIMPTMTMFIDTVSAKKVFLTAVA